MQRMLPHKLVGEEQLYINLYDENGRLIGKEGEPVTPGLLIKLCNMDVYIDEESLQEQLYRQNQEIFKHKSVIPRDVAKKLINISKNILKRISLNEKPDLTTCNKATEIIIDEVYINLEKIECVSQLKIFDEYTFSHCVNVTSISSALGITLGLGEEELKELALGALLHDAGKMLVPKDILNKPAKLVAEEYEIMKSHSLLGYRFIKDTIHLPDKIAKVALDHQEKYGGGGYPNNLKGKEINLYAQITSIADVFDALTSNRVYKKAINTEEAIKVILSQEKDTFNPYILSKFLEMADYAPLKPPEEIH